MEKKLLNVEVEEDIQEVVEKLDFIRIVSGIFLSTAIIAVISYVFSDNEAMQLGLYFGMGGFFLCLYYIAYYVVVVRRKMQTYNTFMAEATKEQNGKLLNLLELALRKDTRCFRVFGCRWCAWVCCLWNGNLPPLPGDSDTEEEEEDHSDEKQKLLVALNTV